MRKNRKKVALHRETLRTLSAPTLEYVAGGATRTVNACNSGCNCTVTCATGCAGYTCLPCQGSVGCSAQPQTVCCP
jgi:hypothetical protein